MIKIPFTPYVVVRRSTVDTLQTTSFVRLKRIEATEDMAVDLMRQVDELKRQLQEYKDLDISGYNIGEGL